MRRWDLNHRCPLAVPKILCSLFASQNFDRYANKHSLHRPQDAVVFVAPGTRRSCGSSFEKEKRHPNGCLNWLRRWDLNHRCPLAVPKILCSLFASQNFDRYANKHSLHRPQDAVVFVAPGTRRSCGSSFEKEKRHPNGCLNWLRRWDLNHTTSGL